MRKNNDETDQGRPNNRPLIRDKKQFLLMFRSIRFWVKGASLILKIPLHMFTTEITLAMIHAERCFYDGFFTDDP
jgi:hypothetical protein